MATRPPKRLESLAYRIVYVCAGQDIANRRFRKPILFGTKPVCHVRIRSTSCDPIQARICRYGESFVLERLSPKGKVFVNKELCFYGFPTTLTNQSTISIGPATFRFEIVTQCSPVDLLPLEIRELLTRFSSELAKAFRLKVDPPLSDSQGIYASQEEPIVINEDREIKQEGPCFSELDMKTPQMIEPRIPSENLTNVNRRLRDSNEMIPDDQRFIKFLSGALNGLQPPTRVFQQSKKRSRKFICFKNKEKRNPKEMFQSAVQTNIKTTIQSVIQATMDSIETALTPPPFIKSPHRRGRFIRIKKPKIETETQPPELKRPLEPNTEKEFCDFKRRKLFELSECILKNLEKSGLSKAPPPPPPKRMDCIIKPGPTTQKQFAFYFPPVVFPCSVASTPRTSPRDFNHDEKYSSLSSPIFEE